VPLPILIASIAAPALALAGLGFLLFRLRSQLNALRVKQENAITSDDLREFREAVAELGRRMARVETDLAAVPSMPRGNINVSKRGQVIRLHRRGDDTAEIAGAVGLRRAEVDLIIKMQRLAGTSAHAPSPVVLNPESKGSEEVGQTIPAAPVLAAMSRPTTGSILRL
jgi:hypothetical protein